MDLTATALALAGVTADPKWPIDGIDLMPFLAESKKMPERALFWNCPTNGRQWAIRRGDFKLTCALPEKVTRPISGLYDLRKDIGEQQDLASSNPELFKQLQEEWEAWNKQVMAGKPVPAVKKSDVNKAL
jgi:arylsulfatase A-like enzyme